jgi:hypothetical protein
VDKEKRKRKAKDKMALLGWSPWAPLPLRDFFGDVVGRSY